jgi:hypothetical protein
MNTPNDPNAHAAPSRAEKEAAVAAAPPIHEPPPPSDAGEPMGSKDPDRPAMLGKRYRRVLLLGMIAGCALALAAHRLLAGSWDSNGWGWLLAALGGIAVGGACSLFIYGVSTDRTDTGPTKPRGSADVSTKGEWRRTLERRRRRQRR